MAELKIVAKACQPDNLRYRQCAQADIPEIRSRLTKDCFADQKYFCHRDVRIDAFAPATTSETPRCAVDVIAPRALAPLRTIMCAVLDLAPTASAEVIQHRILMKGMEVTLPQAELIAMVTLQNPGYAALSLDGTHENLFFMRMFQVNRLMIGYLSYYRGRWAVDLNELDLTRTYGKNCRILLGGGIL